jgi:hypothetical protein
MGVREVDAGANKEDFLIQVTIELFYLIKEGVAKAHP